MSKEIKIGGDRNYTIEYSPETAIKVLDKIVNWMEQKNHYASHSGEGIFQDDDCQADSINLIADIIDDILIPKSLDEEDF